MEKGIHKKDQHPVYNAENNRLRTEMMILPKKPENKDKKIVISKGKLHVNDDIVDKNLFTGSASPLNILAWNINGVKNEFLQIDVCKMLEKLHIILLAATHYWEN